MKERKEIKRNKSNNNNNNSSSSSSSDLLREEGRIILCTRRQKIYYEMKRIYQSYEQNNNEIEQQQQVVGEEENNNEKKQQQQQIKNYTKLHYLPVSNIEIIQENIAELCTYHELIPKLKIAMKCIYCIFVTYYTIIILPLLQNYYENKNNQQHILLTRTASSDCYEDDPFIPTHNIKHRIKKEWDSTNFNEFPYFWTVSSLEKRKLITFWLKFHEHIEQESIHIRTCMKQFNWINFRNNVLSTCNPDEVALCFTSISQDEFFLESSQLFPHAIYRALFRQINCNIFHINNSQSLEKINLKPLHVENEVSKVFSQWILYMMEKIKNGLVSAGKSSDPMNKSFTQPPIPSSPSHSLSLVDSSSSLKSPTTTFNHSHTPRYMKSIPKQIVIFISEIDNINNNTSLYEWYEEYQVTELNSDEMILPQWIQYLNLVLSVCHTFDHLHILYSISSQQTFSQKYNNQLPPLDNSNNNNNIKSLILNQQSNQSKVGQSQINNIIIQSLNKCCEGNPPIFTCKELQLNQYYTTRRTQSSILSFYQQNLIPYATHIRESNKCLKMIPPLCIIIHLPNILSSSSQISFSNSDCNANLFWSEDHDIIIQTKTTRQITQLVLSKKLDTLIISKTLPSKINVKHYAVCIIDCYRENNKQIPCSSFQYARQLMQPGDILTLLYLKKQLSENNNLPPGDYSNDPQIEELISLYHGYGYNLQIIDVKNETTLANTIFQTITDLNSNPNSLKSVDYLVIEENSYEQFTRNEMLSKKFIRQFSSKSSIDEKNLSPKSSNILQKLKKITSSNESLSIDSTSPNKNSGINSSPSSPIIKYRHLQYIRILSLFLSSSLNLSIFILYRRDFI